jgi:hypothetical protein
VSSPRTDRKGITVRQSRGGDAASTTAMSHYSHGSHYAVSAHRPAAPGDHRHYRAAVGIAPPASPLSFYTLPFYTPRSYDWVV